MSSWGMKQRSNELNHLRLCCLLFRSLFNNWRHIEERDNGTKDASLCALTQQIDCFEIYDSERGEKRFSRLRRARLEWAWSFFPLPNVEEKKGLFQRWYNQEGVLEHANRFWWRNNRENVAKGRKMSWKDAFWRDLEEDNDRGWKIQGQKTVENAVFVRRTFTFEDCQFDEAIWLVALSQTSNGISNGILAKFPSLHSQYHTPLKSLISIQITRV
jgi:hypothetical protein